MGWVGGADGRWQWLKIVAILAKGISVLRAPSVRPPAPSPPLRHHHRPAPTPPTHTPHLPLPPGSAWKWRKPLSLPRRGSG